MKNSLKTAAFVLAMILGWSFEGMAQTTQYVTLTAAYAYGGLIGGLGALGTGGNNFAVQPNQTVSRVGYDAGSTGGVYSYGQYQDGTVINLGSGQIFTGLTNISVFLQYSGGLPPPSPPLQPGAATFQITTPTCANVVSNYVPADAIVIPASATGSVQIILESSPDLVNWTAANPGTYGASAGTNRFFGVRAAVN